MEAHAICVAEPERNFFDGQGKIFQERGSAAQSFAHHEITNALPAYLSE